MDAPELVVPVAARAAASHELDGAGLAGGAAAGAARPARAGFFVGGGFAGAGGGADGRVVSVCKFVCGPWVCVPGVVGRDGLSPWWTASWSPTALDRHVVLAVLSGG